MKKAIKNEYGVKVGDIFACSWGYDQTNVDCYQVVKVNGRSMVTVREIALELIYATNSMAGSYMPVKGDFVGSELLRKKTQLYETLADGSHTAFIKMAHSYAYQWDHKLLYQSSYH